MTAQRNRAITEIKQEIEAAKTALKSIESAGNATEAEVNRLASQLDSNAQKLKEINGRENSTHSEMAKIEKRILASQSESSEWARKVDEIEQDRLKLEEEFHRILKLPKDLAPGEDLESHRLHHFASLSKEQSSKLDADANNQEAVERLISACRELSALEHRLFEADKQWKTANDQLVAAHQEEAEQHAESRKVGAENRETKKKLKSLAELAAQARATIANGENQLRQMGVKP
ncbi:MAG: hypothetical protein R3C01_04085 [Planctomycetaceae bacterium]